jgi:hypothetical protein
MLAADHDALVVTDEAGGAAPKRSSPLWLALALPPLAPPVATALWPDPSAGSWPDAIWTASPPVSAAAAVTEMSMTLTIAVRREVRRLPFARSAGSFMHAAWRAFLSGSSRQR